MKRMLLAVCLMGAAGAVAVAGRGGAAPPQPAGGTLARFSFEEGHAWAGLSAYAAGGVTARAAFQEVGTVDTTGGTTPSRGALLTVTGADGGTAKGAWRAGLTSGKLPVKNAETALGKLTLAFSLSASDNRPVTVRVESFDAAGKRTGGLEGRAYPAAPDFYQRYALDLSMMKPAGPGAFRPTDPSVQFTFEVSGTDGPAGGQWRVDNVHYAAPAFYVRPDGKDTNDGRTEATAFATPQKAVDAAQPGDIVLVMNGTYLPHDKEEGVAAFRRGGTPDAWVTLKNYPGHKPRFSPVGAWNAIRIGQRGTKDAPSPLPALAYIELRGLHVRGDADVAKEKYADRMNKPDPFTNGNAMTITGRFESNTPHHIRVADNLLEYCAGGGTGSGECDWMTVENNVIRNNCWWMIYAGSGISLLGTANFDATDNVYKDLIRNNVVSGNRCFNAWKKIGKVSDGNGIIIDSNHHPKQNQSHRGRTLIQNNLCVNNGGSGIHSFRSHRVDIVNNTAYLNGASPELRWGQIFLQATDDARVVNNILWARDGQPVNTVGLNSTDKENTNVVRANNLYFGGAAKPIMGEGDAVADPQFVKPATDPAVADFRLRPESPARGKGVVLPFVPWLDLDGKPRLPRTAADAGAFQSSVPARAADARQRN